MRILGVDPGKTTGAALFDVEENQLLESHQLAFDDAAKELQRLVRDADHVAVERFSIGSGRGESAVSRQYEVLYVIGGVIFLCALEGTPIKMQTLADARAAFPDWVLRNDFSLPPGVHARDAFRHALLAARILQKRM